MQLTNTVTRSLRVLVVATIVNLQATMQANGVDLMDWAVDSRPVRE